MNQLLKLVRVSVLTLLMAGLWLPSIAAASSDIVQVTVEVTIDNPDYFWKYPFWGQPLDSIRIYGLGKTVQVPIQSAGESIIFDVPKGYKLRLALGFQSGSTTLKEVNYLTQWGISDSHNNVKIRLAAPDLMPVQIKSDELEVVR